MTEYGLFPSYVVFHYHSTQAPHTMTVPTRQWNSAIGTGGAGGYTAYDEGARDALDMITDFATALAANFSSAVVIDDFIIYNYPAEDADSVPVAGGTLAITGTEATPGWWKAVASQINFFDTSFNPVKIVMLDSASFNDFEKRTAGDAHSGQTAVINAFTDVENAWASRAGLRPNIVRSITNKLNDELRAQYGMG